MEKVRLSLSNTYSHIPANLKDSALGDAIGGLSGELVNTKYRKTENNIKTLLTDLDLLSARYDNAIKEQSNELVGVLASIKSRADPVNLSTGNFVYDHEDLKIGGDISMSFHRYYNSLDRVQSSLGRCFVHNYDIKLEFDGSKKAAIRMHDGQRKNFILKENGIYTGLGSANETEYSYDCMGKLTEVKRCGSEDIQTTKYEWNLEGKLIRKTDPLGNVETFTYDRCGRMTSKCDKDGYNTTYSYNSTGLMEKILYADGTDVEYTYDALRKLKEIKDATGITTMEYDILGRVVSVTTPDQKTTGYEWGSMGERRSITYPDGKKAVYGYDEAMKLKTLETAKGITEYSYDSLGRLCQKELPNDVTTTYDYNSLGRLTAMSHIKEGFTEAYTYEYDAVGNRLKTTKTSVRDGISDNSIYEYGYDELDHLTEVKRNGDILRRYGYDSYGNRTIKEDFENGGQTTAYTYNGNNQIVTGITGDLEEVYGYDRRGNLTSVTSGGNLIKSYRFDYANRMTSATERGEDSTRRAEYAYNGMGHRISQYLYVTDPESEINEMLTKEISYTVDMTKKYNNLLNMQESVYGLDSYYTAEDIKQAQTSKNFYWDNTVVSMEEEEMESYFILDELGSPIELMDEDGFIRESYSYDEFGRMYTDESHQKTTPLQPFGFTGYQMDGAGGLYYAQARRYDAVNGRFVSKDSDRYVRFSRPDSLNQYMYCLNNPIKYIDVTGNDIYIITLEEFKHGYSGEGYENNTEEVKQAYIDYYAQQGIDVEEPEVHYIEVHNNEEFINQWNTWKPGNDPNNIDILIIEIHGTPYSLEYSRDAYNTEFMTVDDLKNLDGNKDYEYILMLSCNAGYYDASNENLAMVITGKTNNAYVLASDGTVYHGDFTNIQYGDGYKSLPDSWYQGYKGDAESEIDNLGWLIYYINNEEINVNIYDSNDKSLTVKEMLEYMISSNKE